MILTDLQRIKDIYRDAAEFFSNIEERLGRDTFYGFKILNAPPIFRPECFFVGFQPSGTRRAYEQERKYEALWPTHVQYKECVGQLGWRLADRMVESFGAEYLGKCMGSNAIFMRYPDIKSYNDDDKVCRAIRVDVEKFSLDNLSKIIEIVEPKRVVTIGFSVLELFGKPTIDSISPSGSGRVLTRSGMFGDTSAVGMLHLTGCRISKSDRKAIGERIKTIAPLDWATLKLKSQYM